MFCLDVIRIYARLGDVKRKFCMDAQVKARDAKALQVARLVQQRERPELAILFGSRARGDHNETRSDIDIMLVQAVA